MTDAEARKRLRALRDLLFALALAKWTRDGWTTQTHLECRSKDRHDHARLAVIDDEHDENVVHVYPHPAELEQPVEKTMLHEVVGHILFELDGSKAHERYADHLEDLLWPLLSPSQRRVLKNLVGPAP